MKIELEQSDIEKAVHAYVADQGIKVEGKELTINFSLTRGDAGLIAALNITDPKPETKGPKARLGTVGATIKQAEAKAEVKAAPTTAKAAVEQALAAANAGKVEAADPSGGTAGDVSATGTDSAEEQTKVPAETGAAEGNETAAAEESTAVVEETKPASTKSLFG